MPPLPAVAGARQRLFVWGLMMLALLCLGAWWWLAQGGSTRSPEAPAALAQSVERPSFLLAPEATPGTVPASPAEPVSEAERLRLSLERLAQEDRMHTAELEQQREARALERQRLERQRQELVRRRAEEAAVVPTADEPRVLAEPERVAVAELPPVRPAPEPVPTVELACAGNSNFFTRDLCRIRECGKAAFASDPTCVRFRQMDEANRQRGDN